MKEVMKGEHFEVQWLGHVNYDFTDKENGKRMQGRTKKVLLCRFNEGGELVRVELCKTSPDWRGGIGECGRNPVYDRFGRFAGFCG